MMICTLFSACYTWVTTTKNWEVPEIKSARPSLEILILSRFPNKHITRSTFLSCYGCRKGLSKTEHTGSGIKYPFTMFHFKYFPLRAQGHRLGKCSYTYPQHVPQAVSATTWRNCDTMVKVFLRDKCHSFSFLTQKLHIWRFKKYMFQPQGLYM